MMYRSASWNKFSDDYFKHATSSSSSSSISPGQRSSNDLPTYDPIVELAKKEKARVKFSENAVHVIPFVLLVCAIILWIFSNPGELYIYNDIIRIFFIFKYWWHLLSIYSFETIATESFIFQFLLKNEDDLYSNKIISTPVTKNMFGDTYVRSKIRRCVGVYEFSPTHIAWSIIITKNMDALNYIFLL